MGDPFTFGFLGCVVSEVRGRCIGLRFGVCGLVCRAAMSAFDELRVGLTNVSMCREQCDMVDCQCEAEDKAQQGCRGLAGQP
jgi:hypothetical protein